MRGLGRGILGGVAVAAVGLVVLSELAPPPQPFTPEPATGPAVTAALPQAPEAVAAPAGGAPAAPAAPPAAAPAAPEAVAAPAPPPAAAADAPAASPPDAPMAAAPVAGGAAATPEAPPVAVAEPPAPPASPAERPAPPAEAVAEAPAAPPAAQPAPVAPAAPAAVAALPAAPARVAEAARPAPAAAAAAAPRPAAPAAPAAEAAPVPPAATPGPSPVPPPGAVAALAPAPAPAADAARAPAASVAGVAARPPAVPPAVAPGEAPAADAAPAPSREIPLPPLTPEEQAIVAAAPPPEPAPPPAPPAVAPPAAMPDTAPEVAQATGGGALNRAQPLRPVAGLARPAAPEAAAPPAEPAAAPAVPEDAPPRIRFARPFENPTGKPLFSVVLIDTGEPDLDRAALAALPIPVTFVLDPMAPTAELAATIYRDGGQEIAMLATGLPEGATAQDVEVTFAAHDSVLPQVVAVVDLERGGFQDNRTLASAVVPRVGSQGLGLLSWDRGLNAAAQVARREGVAAATILRRIDAEGEAAPMMRRYLDRAAFKAAQDGRVVVAGSTRPETVAVLLEWAVEGRASSVALAPLSAVLQP